MGVSGGVGAGGGGVGGGWGGAFAAEVDQDAATGLLDGVHGVVELGSAGAGGVAEDVAEEALSVDADEHGFVGGCFRGEAEAEGEVGLRVEDAFVGDELEVSPGGGESDGLDPSDELLPGEAVADEVGDGADAELVPLAEVFEVVAAHHFAVVAEDFADDGGGFHAGEACEVDGAFGLAGADEDAAVAGAEGVDVAGSEEVLRLGVVGDGDLHGDGAVLGTDAGGDAEAGVGVDGDGEVGAELGGVLLGLGVELEAVALLAGEREADDAASVGDHEVDGFGGAGLGGVDDVAFIFAVFVVDEDDGLARPQVGQDVLDGAHRHGLAV